MTTAKNRPWLKLVQETAQTQRSLVSTRLAEGRLLSAKPACARGVKRVGPGGRRAHVTSARREIAAASAVRLPVYLALAFRDETRESAAVIAADADAAAAAAAAGVSEYVQQNPRFVHRDNGHRAGEIDHDNGKIMDGLHSRRLGHCQSWATLPRIRCALKSAHHSTK